MRLAEYECKEVYDNVYEVLESRPIDVDDWYTPEHVGMACLAIVHDISTIEVKYISINDMSKLMNMVRSSITDGLVLIGKVSDRYSDMGRLIH